MSIILKKKFHDNQKEYYEIIEKCADESEKNLKSGRKSFTPKFEFLHQIDIEGGYPISYRYDKLFSGDDWKNNERWKKYEDELAKYDVQVVYFPYTKA